MVFLQRFFEIYSAFIHQNSRLKITFHLKVTWNTTNEIKGLFHSKQILTLITFEFEQT